MKRGVLRRGFVQAGLAFAALACSGIGLSTAAAATLPPSPPPESCGVSVMISGAFSAPYQVLAPPFAKARDKVLCTAGGPSMGATPQAIPNRLARGEPADVVILARAALDDLVAKGQVVRGSEVDLVRSKIAMAVRQGAPKPDISSADRFKDALLKAKSVAVSDSASGVYISTEMFPRMGIAEQIAGKWRAIPATPVGREVAEGRAELGLQQLSELLPIAGIEIVGAVPEPWQRVTVFSAGVVANARHPEEARALIAHLASEAAWPEIRKAGLEPAGAPAAN